MLNVVVAPIYDLDPARPTLSRHGNTSVGMPPGTQVYTTSPVSGPGFTAQLFGGPPHAAALNLQPVPGLVPFRSGNGAGFVVSPLTTVSVPGVPEGAPAKVQLRVWHTRGGSITNWGQVEMDPTVPHGVSWPFLTGPLGGPFRPPPNLVGLESFSLVIGTTPETGLLVRINFQPRQSQVPAGCIADVGASFGPGERGLVYGWNSDHASAAQTRASPTSPDLRHDSYIEMRHDSVWEIELANGLYAVHIAAGDPLMTNGTMRMAIEQRAVIDGRVTATVNWLEADALIDLQDGRLTLSGAAAPAINRLCFIDLVRVDPVRLDTPSLPLPTSGFPIRFNGEPGFPYQIERTDASGRWDSVGVPIPVRGLELRLLDPHPTLPLGLYRARTGTIP